MEGWQNAAWSAKLRVDRRVWHALPWIVMLGSIRMRPAWVVALLVLSLATVEMPHMAGAHYDPDCDIVVVAHDASAHRIDGTGHDQNGRPEHCLACHWGRSFRPGVESSALNAPVVETTVALVTDQSFISSRAPVAQPPLRAPPA